MAAKRLAEATKANGSGLAKLRELYSDDFVGFCSLLEIIPKSGVRARFKLNEIQAAYCAARTQRDVSLKGRQIGFTTLEQARDIWFFLIKPGARVVATCQSISDHGPLNLLSQNYRVFFDSLRRRGYDIRFRSESRSEWLLADADASLRIVEAGASEASAEKKGRAGTITRLHMTETAFYEYAEETLNALLECVPGVEYGSEIVSESTPKGASGVFYQQCQAAGEERSAYKLHFFPWFAHGEYRLPLIDGETIEAETDREKYLTAQGVSVEQIKWYRKKLADKGSQDLVDQEYPSDSKTCFLVSGRTFFDRSKTQNLLTASLSATPVEVSMGGKLRIWEKPVQGLRYVIGVDTSEGTGGDPGAAIVYERDTGAHVATLHGQFPPWELARAVAEIGRRYNGATIAVERNNHGAAVLQALDKDEPRYTRVFLDRDEKPGWLNTEVSRTAGLDAFEDAHRRGDWLSADPILLGELLTFVVTDKGKAEAARGSHDDLVMAAMIGWDVIRKPATNTRTTSGAGWR